MLNPYRLVFVTCVVWLGLPISPAPAELLFGGDIIIADPRETAPPAALIRVDPVTGGQAELTAGGFLMDPRDVAVEPTGKILVADPAISAIVRVDPTAFDPLDPGANQTIVSQGGVFREPRGVVVADDGSIYVTDRLNPFPVVRIDPDTGAQEIVAQGGNLKRCRRLAIGPDGWLYLPRFTGGTMIVRVDPNAFDPLDLFANQEIVASGGLFNKPWDVVFDLAGRLLVLNTQDWNVIRIDVDAYDPLDPLANQELVADGGAFKENRGIALEEDGMLLVTDENTPADVIRVDTDAFDPLDPGSNQTIVASGPPMDKPRGLETFPTTDCNDGIDNDGDGRIDYDDFTCKGPLDPSELAECFDGFDNDGDGFIDASDPQCDGLLNSEVRGTGGPGCGLGSELLLVLPALLVARRLRSSRAAGKS